MQKSHKGFSVGRWLASCLFIFLVAGTVLPAHASKTSGVLNWATDEEVTSTDPYYTLNHMTIVLMDEICDSPLRKNADSGEYGPHLATNYKWVDGTTLDMEFRTDVVFHSGKTLSAKDVKYTFDHILATNSGVVAASSYNYVKSVELLGPNKVRLHFHHAFPMALEYLSTVTPILPYGHYDNAPVRDGKKDYRSVPLDCTGPYKIVNFKPGQSMEFEANEKYFGGGKQIPAIKTLKFRTMIDPDAQLVELLAGKLNWIWNLSPDKVAELKNMKQLHVVSVPNQRFNFISMDAAGKFGKNPFQDIRVRKAVNHAINRKPIAKNLIGEASEVIDSACHPKQFGCFTNVNSYEYNPGKAKKLLVEAGYPDGFTTDFYAYREKDVAEAIISDLRAVGIKANLRFLQYNAVRPLVRSGEASFAYLSWGSSGVGDVSASTSYFFSGSPDDNSRDAEVQGHVRTADTSTDPEVRKSNYKLALKRISDQAYWVPLFTMVRSYAFSNDVDTTGYFDGLPHFYNARWK